MLIHLPIGFTSVVTLLMDRSCKGLLEISSQLINVQVNLSKLQYWDSNIAVNIAGVIKLSNAEVSILFTWNKS